MESQKQFPKTYSFEFFPPKTEQGMEKLRTVRKELAPLNPLFFSVTFGAGGSTQDRSFASVDEIQKEGLADAAPHLSCIGSTKDGIRDILAQYQASGIKHIVALRGDMPSGMQDPGEFRYANELVEFIRAETGDHFRIEVASYPEFHPQAPSAEADLDNFKRKVDAGADSSITQYFYNVDAYRRFIDACEARNINIPVVPGIMPITNIVQLARFSDMCGAEIPRWLRKRLEAFGDDMDSLKAFGKDVVVEMCQTLLDEGCPGLHFYTMNQSEATLSIWNELSFPQ